MIPYLVTAMLVAGLGVARVLLVAGLGVAHGLEPDHLAAMRTMRTRREYLKFSVGHSLGFALISIPIVLLFGLVRELEWAGDIIGLAMGVVLLYEELSGREFQLSGGPIGVAQGALALTPSKVLLAVLAAEAGLLLGGVYVALFVLISSSVMFFFASAMEFVPPRASKALSVVIAITTIVFISLTFLGLIRGA